MRDFCVWGVPRDPKHSSKKDTLRPVLIPRRLANVELPRAFFFSCWYQHALPCPTATALAAAASFVPLTTVDRRPLFPPGLVESVPRSGI
ncbi:unnamed protein product [Penicillium roqueforti FM164]|uniref:Genomic scaffold, ProqFM164S02 n=1 Tax=Penicillium roqueforti (strain FM164) TaxID=1365484 RepID=W6QQJ0_PENRF|nr:unnamed protein product [Penicillium roqueforti FM164]